MSNNTTTKTEENKKKQNLLPSGRAQDRRTMYITNHDYYKQCMGLSLHIDWGKNTFSLFFHRPMGSCARTLNENVNTVWLWTRQRGDSGPG